MRQLVKKEYTDQSKRQYIGNLGKIENGIIAVTAYVVIDGITFLLIFEVYKPKERPVRQIDYLSKADLGSIWVKAK